MYINCCPRKKCLTQIRFSLHACALYSEVPSNLNTMLQDGEKELLVSSPFLGAGGTHRGAVHIYSSNLR